MSRNRLLILRVIHFNNNESINADLNDRIRKLTPLLAMLKKSHQDVIVPEGELCVSGLIIFSTVCPSKYNANGVDGFLGPTLTGLL